MSTRGSIHGHHRGSVNAKFFFSQACRKPTQLFFDLSLLVLLSSTLFFGLQMCGKKGTEMQKLSEDAGNISCWKLRFILRITPTYTQKKIFVFFKTAGRISLDSPQNTQRHGKSETEKVLSFGWNFDFYLSSPWKVRQFPSYAWVGDVFACLIVFNSAVTFATRFFLSP